jgi:beta-fructofuranosidase
VTLRLEDRWIWDFWLVSDGDLHHAFYLQAPTSLGDPELRHRNATIGHATSFDLSTWTPVDDAFGPGPAGSFDDRSTWTGSVVRFRDRWVMLYTGTANAERGLVQRIGLATSTDLHGWSRGRDAVLAADPTYYETLDLDLWIDEAWRDPWSFVGPDDGRLHVYFTARAAVGDRFDRGVIGHACTSDLRTWEVLPPLDTAGDGFGQREVPQLFEIDGRWYLLFCSDVPTQSPERRRRGPGTGTYYLVGESPYGPFTMIGDGALAADPTGSSYAGRLHRTSDGTVWFLDWDRCAADGSFIGGLGAPRRVESLADGSLVLTDRGTARTSR